MKLKDIKQGDIVAVNNLPNGEVYEVGAIVGFNVHLWQTIKGQVYDSGWIDIDRIKKPTESQLANRRY